MQHPHTHIFTPDIFTDAGLGSDLEPHSRCRAPGGLRNGRTWCYTTDADVRWDWCDLEQPPGNRYTFGGLRIESIHPFGGPAVGGTLLTISGRYFLQVGVTSVTSVAVVTSVTAAAASSRWPRAPLVTP